ncbi:MAG TPA: hypothetical protein VNE39_09150 [Planctomycetota bacterium]|nr:hypothetical protein [Planctomycetota bacterium]
MSSFDQARLTGDCLELRWEGIAQALACSCFPVWVSGELLRVPILRAGRKGRGWVASGELTTERGTWEVEDRLMPRGNTLVVARTWRWRGGRLGNVRFGMDLWVPFAKLEHWAIPYISMNGNAGSKSAPTGMAREGKPWVFREERTTAPGLMALEAGGLVAGSYTEPGRSERTLSACCILPGKGGYTLRTFVPFRESPGTFLGTALPRTGQGVFIAATVPPGFVVEDGARFRRRFFVVLDRAGAKRHGYVRVWESAWRNLRAPIAPGIAAKKAERLLWRSIGRFWVRKGEVRGFALRVDRDGDPFGSFTPVLSAGWCAPTMMLAYLALRRAIRAHRPSLAEKAIQAAEFFIENAPRGNGAFLTHFDLRELRWTDREVNAVQMGGAAYWLLRCVELLSQTKLFARRIDVRRWTDFALGFCDLAVRTQAPSGAFGSQWTLDGQCLGTERAMGVHAARAVLEAWRLTGRKEYLRAAERGASFYVRTCVDREAGYGDCTDLLDTTTENDGAGVADLLIDLYRATGKPRYLDKAIRAGEYCLAFLFAYNVHFPPETDCGRRRMRTRGLGAISPETAFVCWWFALQANAFLELWRETGERRWRDYAVAVVRASLQMMAEPGDTFGLAGHLVGCRGEVIPVADTVKWVHVWKKGMTGYAWHEPVWWPAAFNLLNLALIEDRFPEVLPRLHANSSEGRPALRIVTSRR